MRLSIEAELDYFLDGAADVLLQIEVAAMTDQRLIRQDLRVWCAEPLAAVPGEDSIGQRAWARGDGPFRAEYSCEVEIDRCSVDFAALAAAPPRALPALTIPYLMPSRYCEAERFESFVNAEFGDVDGGAKVQAISDWVSANIAYECGSSSGETSAMTTFVERRGVCRDFAHLVVAMSRAGGIPARCVSAYAPGVEPQDFHAVAEVWLADGWHLIDATGMASCADLARVAVGRDATDIAFMTVFGKATMNTQRVRVQRLSAPDVEPVKQ